METKSKEYMEFLEEEKRTQERTFYEKLCKFAEKIPIKPPKDVETQYREAIDFCHLKITPKGAFSLSILAGLLTLFVPLIISLIFGVFSLVFIIFLVFMSFFIFYYLYDRPLHLAITYRIKASSEMVLSVLYMTISMRVTPNLENAIKFASKNLSGPLASDLKNIIWDVYTRKYDSVHTALDKFIEKWKKENEEFTQAIYLISTSVSESSAKMEKVLDEAVSIILDGNRERMKRYAQGLRTPVTVLNALGILLPIIGLIFFPIIGIFMPEAIKPIFLIVGYNFFLPIIVYWMMKNCLEKRPSTFHQPDMSKHPMFAHEKFFNKNLIVSFLIGLTLISFGAYKLSLETAVFNFNLLFYSILITIGVSSGIVIYMLSTVRKKIKLRDEIAQMETEFAEVLFQFGNQLSSGIPIESALKKLTPKIKGLKISKMFEKILYNIETFGMTFEQAVFDEKSGVINQYPSKTIEAVMRAIVDISKRGMDTTAKAVVSISKYLKDVHAEEEELRGMMSEVTSNMSIQALLLAPLSSGIVVGLTAIVMKMLMSMQGVLDKTFQNLGNYGPAGSAGSGVLGSMINLNKMIPVHYFQLIVAVYLIEVVGMLGMFLSIINNGDEDLLKKYTMGKMIAIGIMVYIIVLSLSYGLFSTFIPVTGFI